MKTKKLKKEKKKINFLTQEYFANEFKEWAIDLGSLQANWVARKRDSCEGPWKGEKR